MKNTLRLMVLAATLGMAVPPALASGPGGNDPPPSGTATKAVANSPVASALEILLSYLGL